jgi:hypothetical protein
MTDHPPPPPLARRHVDLRVAAARDVGFAIYEAGEIVAAVTSRAEVAEWIERRLGLLPGELEREAVDFEATREAMANVELMPQVVRPRTEPRRRGRGLFGG